MSVPKHHTYRGGGDVSATGLRPHIGPEDVTAALGPLIPHEADGRGENTKGTAEDETRWWGEQQQQQLEEAEERASHRLVLLLSEINTNFEARRCKKTLQHVGSKSLVGGAESEQVPFCSRSAAEALEKVVTDS